MLSEYMRVVCAWSCVMEIVYHQHDNGRTDGRTYIPGVENTLPPVMNFQTVLPVEANRQYIL
jgi:hypothetical protein